MPTYSYTAKSFSGETKKGTREAQDEHELAKLLHQEGYVLIAAEVSGEGKRRWSLRVSFPFLGGVSLAEKMMFTRNLRIMVGAGIPLPRALNTLSLQAKSKQLRRILQDMAEKILRGYSFSSALEDHRDVFSELFVRMVAVGEESGTLEEVLDHLTSHLEREYELRSKIRGALLYPAVVICAMVAIGFLMLIVVVPQLAATFQELKIELPFTTRIVILLGTLLADKWYFGPLFIIIAVFLFRSALSFSGGKKIKDLIFLRLPVLSPIMKQVTIASLTRTLSSLIAAGVPILQALEIVSRSVGNEFFKSAIREGAEKVKKGQKLSEALGLYKELFSPTMVQMIAIGEETGQMSEILKKLSEFYEQEVTNATKNLASVIEPILMLLVGGVVGFFAVSMIQPMYSMLEAI